MQKFGRRDHLRTIEKNIQMEWKANKVYEAHHVKNWEQNLSFEEKNKQKFLVTFPYPYMNGRLHLGHAFSLSKCEFQSRYQRLLGKNVLFPFGFHCTGMPISAAANRIKKEMEQLNNPPQNEKESSTDNKKNAKAQPEKKSQSEILESIGIPKEEIPKFADSNYWLEYFPPRGLSDLEAFGVNCDFSRSFITTDRQKFYDKFIQWHFNKLSKNGKLKFGKRHTIFSVSDDQPCADHDRSEGEGVGTQEYTLVKMRILENLPEKLRKLKEAHPEKEIYLVAATLRPETMYGQTNIYVLPSGEYGVYEMRNGDLFVCSEHSVSNMSYQEMTKESKKFTALEKIKGSELIGVAIKAPLTSYEKIYAIPMETISMTKGTGIVTSVPSDSPDDWVTLREFQNDAKLREKYKVTEDMVNFKPVPIIDIPKWGNLSAIEVVNHFEIKNPKDKEKLGKAKDECYSKGFYQGVMQVGKYKGLKVNDAKDKVKADLISEGLASTYYEPESLVKNRMGENCIVALVDQWFITYGEENWQKFVLDWVKSENFETYASSTKKGFEEIVNWLKEWGCSRTFGLGSRIPWDKQYLIESLSDSTIYMAYYTISNFLHEDIFGDKPKNGISADQLTEEVFDYIFLGTKSEGIETCGISMELLQEMRSSFTYWYPMDLRCSGKDLIGNHLTMSLYNHAAVWNHDKNYMPRGVFCNGYVIVNGEKMSKSKGNFYTIMDIINDYGCDASRIALADCGDTLDDANFVTEIADSSVNRLYSFENFLKILINEYWVKNKDLLIEDSDNVNLENASYFDKIFDNNINYLIDQTKCAYNHMKFKDVLKYGFYEMIVK
jgi:leucyl-tRNA synthetase